MSLATRLSAFFLVTLAVVLAGFSLSIYALARLYLNAQAEHRLNAALETLTAAVEPEPGGLEWEGDDRRLALGRDADADQPRWEVREPSGALVARSANLGTRDLYHGRSFTPADKDVPAHVAYLGDPAEPWLVAQRVLHASDGPQDPTANPGTTRPRLYPTLVLCPAVSLAPARATLRALAVALTVLSVTLWLATTIVGRRLCRRALTPLTRMAHTARQMDAAEWRRRLPDPHTGDELADLHHAFNGLLDRLQEAFERQRRFTGEASHQLRTPLTAMLGQLDLALRRERPAEDYRRAIVETQAQAQRLRQIVDALLFLARADAEGQPGALEPIDLTVWLPDQLKRWAAGARGADTHLETLGAGPLAVLVQPVLLGQLLDNLLENACKYSERGTPITVHLQREEAAIRLTVTDAGVGIAPEDLPHIFEPFYRGADARQQGRAGTGLGLAVAARIAAALGGSLTAQSAPGKGSSFTLRLNGRPTSGTATIPR